MRNLSFWLFFLSVLAFSSECDLIDAVAKREANVVALLGDESGGSDGIPWEKVDLINSPNRLIGKRFEKMIGGSAPIIFMTDSTLIRIGPDQKEYTYLIDTAMGKIILNIYSDLPQVMRGYPDCTEFEVATFVQYRKDEEAFFVFGVTVGDLSKMVLVPSRFEKMFEKYGLNRGSIYYYID